MVLSVAPLCMRWLECASVQMFLIEWLVSVRHIKAFNTEKKQPPPKIRQSLNIWEVLCYPVKQTIKEHYTGQSILIKDLKSKYQSLFILSLRLC